MAARAPGPLSRSVAETATDLWNDSCGVAELEAAIVLGAVGATANPTIVGDVWKSDPATWQAATRDLAAVHPAWTEIDLAWGIVEAMSLRAAPLLMPVFERTGGRQGRLSMGLIRRSGARPTRCSIRASISHRWRRTSS
jgi:transaldolase